MSKKSEKQKIQYLRQIDNLAAVRTIAAVATFLVQIVVAMHLMGILK